MLTQHMILADMISKHEHLNIKPTPANDDSTSYHTADSKVDEEQSKVITNTSTISTELPKDQISYQTHSQRRAARGDRPSSPSDWSWRPSIPHRTSSMSTRRKKDNCRQPGRPDLATFHRRSCQLFSSLDSTLSKATSTTSDQSRSSTSTSPSLTSSVITQATSILDDSDRSFDCPRFPSFHLELNDTSPLYSGHTSRMTSRRSSSQLNPAIVSTEQVFWTSDSSREKEYAKIDAAHTGLRGLVKRALPQAWKGSYEKRRNFHQRHTASTSTGRDRADSDGESVRRYRIESTVASTPTSPVDAQPPATVPRLDLETGHVGKSHSKHNRFGSFVRRLW